MTDQFISIAKNARRIDGLRVGRLIVLGPVRRSNSGLIVWLCQCDCGNKAEVHGHDLRSDKTHSCGCITKEVQAARFRIHGKSHIPEHAVWSGILARCLNPKNRNFKNYGGRGIEVCSRWRFGDGGKNGFQCFIEDMNERPSDLHSIERKNNDGPYSKDNCIWATNEEQANNKRDSVFITISGQTKTVRQWERDLGFCRGTISDRLRKGWSADKAVLTPLNKVKSERMLAAIQRKKAA